MNKVNTLCTICGNVSEEEKVCLARAYDSHYKINNSDEKVVSGRIKFVPRDKRPRTKKKSDKKKDVLPSKDVKIGEIDYTFPLDEQEEYYPHFFRLSNETDPQFLLRLLLEAWRIKAPKAVMSIIGSEGHFRETDKYSLKRQLLKTVTSTGAWVITDGKDGGASQFVGQAVHEYRVKNDRRDIVTIGFAPWHKTVKCGKKYIFEEQIKNLLPFEPNHSHFILIDSEEKVRKVRLEFEQHISKIGIPRIYVYEKGIPGKQIKRGKNELKVTIKETKKEKSLKIPVVMVVIGGEPDIMIDIKTSLENKIPVIVIQNSGGVADFIASCRSTERTRLVNQ